MIALDDDSASFDFRDLLSSSLGGVNPHHEGGRKGIGTRAVEQQCPRLTMGR